MVMEKWLVRFAACTVLAGCAQMPLSASRLIDYALVGVSGVATVAGGLAGAAAGGTAGSIVPGAGTVAGGIAGTALGAGAAATASGVVERRHPSSARTG